LEKSALRNFAAVRLFAINSCANKSRRVIFSVKTSNVTILATTIDAQVNKQYKNPETLACSRSIGYLHRDERMKQVSDVRGNQVGPHFMALQFCSKGNVAVKIELIVGHNRPPTLLLLSFVFASGADQHWLNLR